jgi:hypothetical protein
MLSNPCSCRQQYQFTLLLLLLLFFKQAVQQILDGFTCITAASSLFPHLPAKKFELLTQWAGDAAAADADADAAGAECNGS